MQDPESRSTEVMVGDRYVEVNGLLGGEELRRAFKALKCGPNGLKVIIGKSSGAMGSTRTRRWPAPRLQPGTRSRSRRYIIHVLQIIYLLELFLVPGRRGAGHRRVLADPIAPEDLPKI